MGFQQPTAQNIRDHLARMGFEPAGEISIQPGGLTYIKPIKQSLWRRLIER